jgi:hypothetical protein
VPLGYITYPPNSTPPNLQEPCLVNATHFSTVIPVVLWSILEPATNTRAVVESKKHPIFANVPTDGTSVGTGVVELDELDDLEVLVVALGLMVVLVEVGMAVVGLGVVMVGLVDVTVGGDGLVPPTHTLLPHVCPGLQALHRLPTVH